MDKHSPFAMHSSNRLIIGVQMVSHGFAVLHGDFYIPNKFWIVAIQQVSKSSVYLKNKQKPSK